MPSDRERLAPGSTPSISAREAAAAPWAWSLLAGVFALTVATVQLRLGAFELLAAPWVVAGVAVIRRRAVELRGDDHGLWVDGKLSVPAAELGDAWLVRRGDGDASLMVARRDGRCSVYRTPDAAAADALVAALPPSRLFVAGSSGTRKLLFMGAWIAAAVTYAAHAHAVSLAFMLVPFVVFARTAFGRKLVIAGDDGFELRTALARRFVPWTSVRSFGEEDVHLEDGSVVALSAPLVVTSSDERESAVARGRLISGMQALFEQAAAARDGSSEAQRALAALPAAARVEAGYREPAATEEALSRIVESSGAGAEARVRAARALVRVGGSEARRRIADAARSTADRELHEALARVVDEEPEAPELRRRA